MTPANKHPQAAPAPPSLWSVFRWFLCNYFSLGEDADKAVLRDELKTLMPDLWPFTASRVLLVTVTGTRPDTLLLVYTRFSRPHSRAEKQRIENWLRSRTKSPRVRLIVE